MNEHDIAEQAYKNGYEACQKDFRDKMSVVIAQIETLKNEAFEKSKTIASAYSANQSGKYSAYHKAASMIAKAIEGNNVRKDGDGNA